MDKIYDKLLMIVPQEQILKDEPMKLHTSFKVGGNAEYFVKAKNINELKEILKYVKEDKIPLFIIGNGSNLLVKDNGVKGIVLKLDFDDYKVEDDVITVQAGMAVSRLSRKALENNLSGLEFLCGIPGTIGGAIKMNAGAYGSEMKDVVIESTYIDKDGKIYTINNEEHKFDYRKSIFSKNDWIVLETKVKLTKSTNEEIISKMNEFTKSRIEKQPTNYPSAGSTFKRGNGFITAKLIDDAGLKGYKIGGAMISDKHAGFIVNTGNATAKDILQLIDIIKEKLIKEFNVEVELEILVIGE